MNSKNRLMDRPRTRSALTVPLFVLCCFLLSGCTYTVRHTSISGNNSPASSGDLTLVIPNETANRVVDQSFGINPDKWQFQIGAAITDILPKVLQSRFRNVIVVRAENVGQNPEGTPALLVTLSDLKWDYGSTLFSDQKINLQMRARYQQGDGSVLFDRDFSTVGSSSGASEWKTWGGLLLFPLAVDGSNGAVENAVTDSLVKFAGNVMQSIPAQAAAVAAVAPSASSAPPRPSSNVIQKTETKCQLGQILTMKKAGLSDQQVEAACK